MRLYLINHAHAVPREEAEDESNRPLRTLIEINCSTCTRMKFIVPLAVKVIAM